MEDSQTLSTPTHNEPMDWEPHRTEITRLYATKTLQEVQSEMTLRFGFHATTKSWKSQITKWNLDTKKIKPAEYRAMLRIKRERGEETQFLIHGVEVPREKLERYEVREKRNRGRNGRIGDVVTPDGLTYRTPSPNPLNLRHPGKKATTNEAAELKSNSPASPKPQDKPRASPNPDPWDDISTYLLSQSHSEELSWFKAFFHGSSSPQPPSFPLLHLLLSFAQSANWQKDSEVTDLLFAKKPSSNPTWIPLCDEKKLLFALPRIHRLTSGISRDWDAKAYRCWTSGAVAMGVAFKGHDALCVLMIGEMTARILLDLGDPGLARGILECVIEEMDGLEGGTPGFLRGGSMVSLARCHFLLGNREELEDWLEEIHMDEFPRILRQLDLALREMKILRGLRRDFDEFESILDNLQRGKTEISEKAHNNITFLASTEVSTSRTAELEKLSTKEAERLLAFGKDMELQIENMNSRISIVKDRFEERMNHVDLKDRALPPWKWVDFEMEALVAGIRGVKLHCLTETLKDHEKALCLPELPERVRNTLKDRGEELLVKLVLFPLESQCLDG